MRASVPKRGRNDIPALFFVVKAYEYEKNTITNVIHERGEVWPAVQHL